MTTISSPLQAIDLTKPAIDQWHTSTDEDRRYWQTYFHLKPFNHERLEPFDQYTHGYSYRLDDLAIVRIVYCAVVELLRYNDIHGMHRACVGNSGGLDSATTCALLSHASRLSQDLGKPFDVIAYGLPVHSHPDHNVRAQHTAKTFGIQHITVEGLETVFGHFANVLFPLAKQFGFTAQEERRALGNVKARIRMIVNFFGTTQPGSYVVSTDNLSELYMAFWTLMGDVGAFGPIQNIFKGLELPAIAYALGVPEQTLQAKPTDGLNVHTSRDEHEGGDIDAFYGVRYPHLDALVCHAVAAGLDLEQATPVRVNSAFIGSPYASQEVVDLLIAQMISPTAVWKRTKGSIGTSLSRAQLGLPPVSEVKNRL